MQLGRGVGGETACGFGARGGDGGRVLGELHGKPVAPRGERGEGLVGNVQRAQPLPRGLRPRQHAVDVGGVLAGERLQLGLPRQHSREAFRIGVEPVEVAGELRADVAEQRQCLREPRVQGGQLSVARGGQPVPGLADQRQRGRRIGHVFGADERGLRRSRNCPQVVGLREPTRLRDERDVLPVLRVDRRDLGEAVAQEIGLLGEAPGAVATLDELGTDPRPLRPHRPVASQRLGDRVAREPVEQRPLLGRP